MSILRIPAKEFIQRSKGAVILDVRSPSEFNHAHFPGALNFPLFSDEERKIVGTIYKQETREAAIKAGLQFFGPKMKFMVEEAEAHLKKASSTGETKPFVFIYCWRGGMRSAGVGWLLDLYGFKVFSLSGGYKSFRNEILQTFQKNYLFKILGGFTGSGKTRVLHELEKHGESIIDLENLASHRGSAFGGFNMPSAPGQEMFENLLGMELLTKSEINHGSEDPVIWLEDESQRIGNINLPPALWCTIRKSPVIFLKIPFEERLDYITEEYGACPVGSLLDGINRIQKRLGGLDAKNTRNYIELGQIREAFHILLKYYDKQYLKALHNREELSSLLTFINCEYVTSKNALKLLKSVQPL